MQGRRFFHLEPLHDREHWASVNNFFGSPLGSPLSGNSHALMSPFCFSDEQEVGILWRERPPMRVYSSLLSSMNVHVAQSFGLESSEGPGVLNQTSRTQIPTPPTNSHGAWAHCLFSLHFSVLTCKMRIITLGSPSGATVGTEEASICEVL